MDGRNKMKILVTGGAGFIGSNIVDLLVKKNYDVTVFDNLSTGNLDNLKNIKFKFIKGDICNSQEINNACKQIDVVYHLAASVGRQKSIDFPVVDANINIIGTINLLEAMKLNNVKKIIYSSSAAIYGELQTELIDENHPINPDSPYGVTKLAAEKMIFAYARLFNITAIALRYFNIYGINQRYDAYGNVIPIFVHKLNKNEPITIFGDGYQSRDFLNVKDVANANYLALNYDKSDYFNLGSTNRITINELAHLLEKYFPNLNLSYAPKRIGDVLHCEANIKKAENLLGFKPLINFNYGLEEYINWFIKSN